MRRAHCLDFRGHFSVGADGVGKDRDQPVAMAFHFSVAHVEIEPRDELAVTAGGDQQCLSNLDDVGQGIMRMSGQDDVDAAHARSELAVQVEAVMREQHDELRAVSAHGLDLFAQIVFADAEAPVRDHPARIGDRGIGQGLADHGDLHAAALEHGGRLEHRVLPFIVADIRARKEKPRKSTISFTRASPSVNSQCPVMASGLSRAMHSTMSCPCSAGRCSCSARCRRRPGTACGCRARRALS